MQNDSIITTNLKEITLSSQFLTLKTPNGEIEIDIKQLLKEPLNSDTAYFNATQIAKEYKTTPSQIFRTENWKEYLKIMEETVNSYYAPNAQLKMVKTIRGKHHSGTWLHSKMIIEFIRRLDVRLAVEIDLFLQNLIIHSNEIKIERSQTKILFKDLTRTIKDIYIPAQESDNAKKFAYNNIASLVNIKVLGCTGTKYAKDNSIEIEDGKSVRDYLSKEQLEAIKEVERRVSGLMEFANITDYEKLREMI